MGASSEALARVVGAVRIAGWIACERDLAEPGFSVASPGGQRGLQTMLKGVLEDVREGPLVPRGLAVDSRVDVALSTPATTFICPNARLFSLRRSWMATGSFLGLEAKSRSQAG